VDRLTIQFALRPLSEVEPWGSLARGVRLHWFGLSDGWYDVAVGERRLFGVLGGDPRGVDYPVVRLWEDLIEVAPFALEALPDDIAARAARGDAWAAWCQEAWDAGDELDELTEVALDWWAGRRLDSGHLRGAPRLDLWRHGDRLHVRWRSPPPDPDDPVWCSPSGDAIVSAHAFLEELIRFDRELMIAMQARVDEVAAGGLRAEIAIDVDELRREQADRASWLSRALTEKPRGLASWDDVVAAMHELERRLDATATATVVNRPTGEA
jgi:hypothetical protein